VLRDFDDRGTDFALTAVMPGEPGSSVPIDPMVVAVGIWDGEWNLAET
jgi:hypothetical protein